MPAASNLLGCLGVALQAWGCGRVLRRLGVGRGVRAAVMLFLLGGGLGSYWYVGMETNIVAALLVWTVERHVAGRSVAAGLLVGMATLVRPDAVVLAALLAVEVAARRLWPVLLRSGLAFAAVVLPWFVFATLYFGTPLPHSLQAKLHSSPVKKYATAAVGQVARAPTSYAQKYSPMWSIYITRLGWREHLGAALLLALLAVAFCRAWAGGTPIAAALLFPLVSIGAYMIIRPPFVHTWHLYPPTVLLLLGGVVGVRDLSEKVAHGSTVLAWLAWISVPVLVGLGIFFLVRFPSRYGADPFYGRRATALTEVANLARGHLRPGDTLGAKEVGIIGYHCPNPIVDWGGINTPGLRLHNAVLRTSIPELVRRYPTDYIITDATDLRAVTATGLYSIVAVGKATGYVSQFLLTRR